MDAVKKVLRKIRHKFKAPEKPEPLWKKLKAEAEAERLKAAFWERDKKIVRDDNFKKALAARAVQLEAINAEKERQIEIADNRLKYLKKARRRQKWLRKQETQE
jgi:hypothetical protein